MEMNVHAAKTNLSQLIQAAEAGEEVFITKHGEVVVQLVPVKVKKPKFGTLEGIAPPVDASLLFAMNEKVIGGLLRGPLVDAGFAGHTCYCLAFDRTGANP